MIPDSLAICNSLLDVKDQHFIETAAGLAWSGMFIRAEVYRRGAGYGGLGPDDGAMQDGSF